MEQKPFENNSFVFYFVATPIGNLQELSPRAISVFKECDYIACEDTRVTQKLLSFFNIKKLLISCHEHNEKKTSEKIINLIKKGNKICYASDAGYPLISDPGKILMEELIKNSVNISIISGPSAFLNALCLSNLPTNHFYFHGFLDAKPSKAKSELELIKDKKETLIFYVSVHKLKEQIKLIFDVLGNRKASLSRELTKLHEHVIRCDLDKLNKKDLSTLKGEFVLVVEGNTEKSTIDKDFIKDKLMSYIKQGFTCKDAAFKVSKELNIKKNLVYSLLPKK